MATKSGSVFARARTSSKPVESEVNESQDYDVREDEEQNVKLGQIIDLLLAAGYFRARIKKLSHFDKVVGGMTWCISVCSFDVDVNLLFQENSTIGQKIELTEKIVAVLPKMKCPHRIEPHQIQGLDFIHIYPVVQWLVKKAIETREEMGDYTRAFAVSQFNKNHQMPEDAVFKKQLPKATATVSVIKEAYKPQRRFKRHNVDRLVDEETRVHSTLLEYGRRYGSSKTDSAEKENDKDSTKKAIASKLQQDGDEEYSEEKMREEEEKKIEMLMATMSAMGAQEGKVTASTVGSIVGMQSEEIQKMVAEYAKRQSEIENIERTERVGGDQQHKRITATLKKQIEQQKASIDSITQKHNEMHEIYIMTQEKLAEARKDIEHIDKEMTKLSELEGGDNQNILNKLRGLVAMNENLKRQEDEFKAHCREEMNRLKELVDKQNTLSAEADSADTERVTMIEKQYKADKEKLQKIRILLGKKTREIASLQRKIDEVPSRAELSQYQRRFIELYHQVAATHRETKQFYTLYNTLDDTKLYLNKEVNLLNSIHDNFSQAMSTPAGKEQFLKQFENIVEGIKTNKSKVEKRKQDEKMKRDRFNDEYLDLIEKQRLYFKTVKEFKEECRKNELLLKKIENL